MSKLCRITHCRIHRVFDYVVLVYRGLSHRTSTVIAPTWRWDNHTLPSSECTPLLIHHQRYRNRDLIVPSEPKKWATAQRPIAATHECKVVGGGQFPMAIRGWRYEASIAASPATIMPHMRRRSRIFMMISDKEVNGIATGFLCIGHANSQ